MCPRLWSIEDKICIGLNVLKCLLNVWHILEKVMSMQHNFEEFSEKKRRVFEVISSISQTVWKNLKFDEKEEEERNNIFFKVLL